MEIPRNNRELLKQQLYYSAILSHILSQVHAHTRTHRVTHTHTQRREEDVIEKDRRKGNTHKISRLVKLASCAGIPPVK